MTAPNKYIIRYRRNEETWNEVRVEDTLLVGTALDSHIIISGEGVGQYHARFDKKADGIWIRYLSPVTTRSAALKMKISGSAKKLSLQDEFNIGDYTFTLLIESSDIDSQKDHLIDKMLAHAPMITVILVGCAILLTVLILVPNWSKATDREEITETIVEKTVTVVDVDQPAKVKTVEPTAPFVSDVNLTPSASPSEIIINPPGKGDIHISPIVIETAKTTIENAWNTISAINQADSIDVITKITGDHIGYVYRYVGMEYDVGAGETQIITIDMSYIGSETVKEFEGNQFPDWGNQIPVELNWKPSVYLISDGENSFPALVYPVDYTSTYRDDAMYAVKGMYLSSGNERRNFARIFFDANGKMMNILGYRDSNSEYQAPFDIIPQKGDRFTILLEEFVFEEYQDDMFEENIGQVEIPSELQDIIGDSSDQLTDEMMSFIGQNGELPYGRGKFQQIEGGDLIYGDAGFSWKVNHDYPGNFIIGVVVEDLDHNYYAAYVPLLVGK